MARTADTNEVCTYPDCNCPFDLTPEMGCLRGLPKELPELTKEPGVKLSTAIAALEAGQKVVNPKGSTFWLETDTKGRTVLVGEPAGYGKKVKHLVFGSGDFHDDWEITNENTRSN